MGLQKALNSIIFVVVWAAENLRNSMTFVSSSIQRVCREIIITPLFTNVVMVFNDLVFVVI